MKTKENKKMTISIQQDPEVQQLLEAFDKTGIRFTDKAATLASIREQGEIFPKEDGTLYMNYRGKVQPLSDVLVSHALANKTEVDQRTLPRNVQDSKENYTSVRSKCDYIAQFGEDAWSMLPSTSVVVPNVVATKSDYHKLSRADKARLADEHGSDYLNTLPDAADPNRPTPGTFINREAIAKLKKICPSRS